VTAAPQPPPAITTQQQYATALNKYNKKHHIYRTLHDLIQGAIQEVKEVAADARSAAAAAVAAQVGGSAYAELRQEQREQAEQRLALLVRLKGKQQLRWGAAFRTLHTELGMLQEELSGWVAKQQQVGLAMEAPQQQQQQQQQRRQEEACCG
jgi:hypothetical protein